MKKVYTDWLFKKNLYSEEIVFTLERGQSLRSLAKQLELKHILVPAWLFEFAVRFSANYDRFQAGTYRVFGELSIHDLINMLENGHIHEVPLFKITIPEGYTLRQISNLIADNGLGTVDEVVKMGKERELLDKFAITGISLEGYIFPASYTFYSKPSIRDVLQKMVQTFFDRLPVNYREQVAQKQLSLHQAVTFASLIELETPHNHERSYISEVIWNRLKNRMTLGIDAAIIYGIPNFDGDLKFIDLQNEANPYNLRIHSGLPPGPIGSPSTQSLLAVLDPSTHGYFYYVVDVASGEHIFAKTLAEHNINVKKMLIDLKNKNQATQPSAVIQ